MTPTAQIAIEKLLALKYLTLTTGTVTDRAQRRAQRELLRTLHGEDMIDVALYLRHLGEKK